MWRADVELAAWEPTYEISHRRVVPADRLLDDLHVAALPFAKLNVRMIREAAIG
jgi:hypothetical protein